MKGMVFTEFLEMVEQTHSPGLAEEIIDSAELPSGGAYTSVGTYDHNEMVTLVGNLSQKTGQSCPLLIHGFGNHLFSRLAERYSNFFDGVDDAFDLLNKVDGYIHVEVRKLYPDAELPRFECSQPDAGTLVMEYTSSRPFADLAAGMIEACIGHFGKPIDVVRDDLPGEPGTHARFTLRKKG